MGAELESPVAEKVVLRLPIFEAFQASFFVDGVFQMEHEPHLFLQSEMTSHYSLQPQDLPKKKAESTPPSHG